MLSPPRIVVKCCRESETRQKLHDAKARQPLGQQTAGQFICCYIAMLIGHPPAVTAIDPNSTACSTTHHQMTRPIESHGTDSGLTLS
jgi:hypothetical protein